MTLKFIEAAKDAMIAFLTAQLPGRITAINAELAGDGQAITLVNPTSYFNYRPLARETLPVVYVLSAVGTSDGAGTQDELRVWHWLQIGITLRDTVDDSKGQRRLERYLRAIVETVLIGHSIPAPSGSAYNYRWGDPLYGVDEDRSEDDESPSVLRGVVSLALRRSESVP